MQAICKREQVPTGAKGQRIPCPCSEVRAQANQANLHERRLRSGRPTKTPKTKNPFESFCRTMRFSGGGPSASDKQQRPNPAIHCKRFVKFHQNSTDQTPFVNLTGFQ